MWVGELPVLLVREDRYRYYYSRQVGEILSTGQVG
jgi:hypothetical protein